MQPLVYATNEAIKSIIVSHKSADCTGMKRCYMLIIQISMGTLCLPQLHLLLVSDFKTI